VEGQEIRSREIRVTFTAVRLQTMGRAAPISRDTVVADLGTVGTTWSVACIAASGRCGIGAMWWSTGGGSGWSRRAGLL
jgi:hypothetical protein